MRPEHVRVVGIEDRGLDRPTEQRVGVVNQVGVERVISGDQYRDRLLPRAPGGARGRGQKLAPPLLGWLLTISLPPLRPMT